MQNLKYILVAPNRQNEGDDKTFSVAPKLNDFGNPLPTLPHATLHSSARTVIVGDVHGCLDELKELLVKCRADELCNLVFCGDLVNKGPYSFETVEFVRSLDNSYCVRGNHDEAALAQALKYHNSQIVPNKKYKYVKQFNSEGIEWLKELPYSISIPKFKAVVVHAGRVPNTTLEEQKPIDFVTMRNIAEESSSGVYEVTESCTDGCSWASKWTDEDWHVYFGHDAKRGLQLYPHATGLDTGVCYGRQLTAIILPSNEIVSVPARCVYEKPKRDD